MTRHRFGALLLAGVLLGALLPLASVSAATPALPSSMAAVGDSISQAASSGGSLGADYPANAWSTGTNTTVKSHYQRLLAVNPAISGRAYNDAVSGAKMADLAGQVTNVIAQQPDYLTVLVGGNDLCTDTVEEMTSVAAFRAQFVAAMDALAAGAPGTSVFVASVPNVTQLWTLFKNDFWARTVWSLGDICQSLLANPTSTTTANVARRAAVAQRNVDYNTVLAEVCAAYATCRFDNNTVYNTAFTKSDVSGDYFHPSIAGQAKLAAATWAAGYWPAAGAPTVHLAAATGSAAARKSGWTATVTVTARSGTGATVSGATVSGTWTGGSAGSCTTGATGTCSISFAAGRKATSVTWTLSAVAASGYVYNPTANAVTSVTVTGP